jgi:hypothetical protein
MVHWYRFWLLVLKPSGHVMYQQFDHIKSAVNVMHQQLNLLNPTGHVMHQQLKLLNPTGHVMHLQFNIQQLYVLPTHCMYVFCIYLRTNSDL